MDSPNGFYIKLKHCKNCFSIVQNDHYVVAVGDRIVVYRKNDWGIQCMIPSKTLPHPYSFQFLSDHTFIVKNNYARYMVYDLVENEILWTFKLRGYDSIDMNFVISLDGTVIYDILTHHSGNPCCTQIVISPKTKQYKVRDLFETAIPIEGWHQKGTGCTTISIYKGNDQKMYLLKEYRIPESTYSKYSVAYLLFQKDIDVETRWELVKKWCFDEPIEFKARIGNRILTRDECQHPIYIDEQCIIWNNFQYENIMTGDCHYISEAETLLTPFKIERKYFPQHSIYFWFFSTGVTHEFRQHGTWERVPELYDFEKSFNERICDIAILDGDGRTLLGTYTGLFLCGPLT